jgi:hypothetical protein
MDAGNNVIEQVFQRIKVMAAQATEDGMGEMNDEAVEGIVSRVRGEFKESVMGNNFLQEIMTEL